MIVVTVFLLIMNPTEIRRIHNQKDKKKSRQQYSLKFGSNHGSVPVNDLQNNPPPPLKKNRFDLFIQIVGKCSKTLEK